MTEPLLIASLLIGAGLLGWILPYRFNIFRLKRFAAVLLPERYHHLVPKALGSLALVLGVVVGVLGLTVLRLDPRGFPVRFVNNYGKPLEWVALEHPKNVEVARSGPVAPGATETLYYKLPSVTRIGVAFKATDLNKSLGNIIPVDVGPRSVGGIIVTVNPNATLIAEKAIF